MGKRERKKLWVDKKMQGALALRVMMHWCIFAVVGSIVALLFQFIADPFQPVSRQFANIWRYQGPFLLTIFFLLPGFLYDTVKLSHRFAGPIIRFRRSLQSIAKGEQVQKVTFRGGDFWVELATDFNVLIERGYFSRPIAENDTSPAETDTKRMVSSS